MAEAVAAEKAQELELCEGAVGFSGQAQQQQQQQQQYPSEVVYQYNGHNIVYQYDPIAQAQLPTLLDPTQGLMVMSDHRRKSVASVQTGGQSSATGPRHPVKRRRSETIDKGRRRRSRPDDDFSLTSDGHSRKDDLRRGNSSASSEGRRGNRNSQLIGNDDLESARMSGHYYKTDHMNGNPDTQDQDEPHRSRVVVVCASIAVGIFLTAILLVAITLRMSPAIDEMGIYVGSTSRLLKVRIDSHRGISFRTGSRISNPEHSNIRNHAKQCKTYIDNKDFSVIGHTTKPQELTILESLFIKEPVPSLNTHTSASQLYLA
ncbi:uncharacterized protein LOC135220481 [Macrobrachium nipponense]|uniref:uncharacterized protein LOC135220481 n=1 Tax=Macrobrachium nipponense TaxID=159736 RepID=UPI0030C86FE6